MHRDNNRGIPPKTELGAQLSTLTGRRFAIERQSFVGPYNPIREMSSEARNSLLDEARGVPSRIIDIKTTGYDQMSSIHIYALFLFAKMFGEKIEYPEDKKDMVNRNTKQNLEQAFNSAIQREVELINLIEQGGFLRLLLNPETKAGFIPPIMNLEELWRGFIDSSDTEGVDISTRGPIIFLHAGNLGEERIYGDETYIREFNGEKDTFHNIDKRKLLEDIVDKDLLFNFIRVFAWTRLLIGEKQWNTHANFTNDDWDLIRQGIAQMGEEERLIFIFYASIMGAEKVEFTKNGQLSLTFEEAPIEDERIQKLPEVVEF